MTHNQRTECQLEFLHDRLPGQQSSMGRCVTCEAPLMDGSGQRLQSLVSEGLFMPSSSAVRSRLLSTLEHNRHLVDKRCSCNFAGRLPGQFKLL